jgi:hypothetical protein
MTMLHVAAEEVIVFGRRQEITDFERSKSPTPLCAVLFIFFELTSKKKISKLILVDQHFLLL